jgi:hypothetical protein
MSVEIDILPLVEDGDETARLADLLEGVATVAARWAATAHHALRICGGRVTRSAA